MSTSMTTTVQLNKKATVIAMVGGAFSLYIAYSWLFAGGSEASAGKGLRVFNTWKTADNVDIPQDILDKEKSVVIDEHTVTFDFEGKTFNVYTKKSTPAAPSPKKAVFLLLHGMAFTSENWVETRTLPLIAAAGHEALAVDLPGFGKTKGEALDDSKRAAFLAKFLEQQQITKPVVVSPSMSGSFALPFIMGEEPAACQKRIRAFISLAPGATEQYHKEQYEMCKAPTLIVYGTKDEHIGIKGKELLKYLPNSVIYPMEGKGHPCYIEDPVAWRKVLYNFIKQVEEDPSF